MQSLFENWRCRASSLGKLLTKEGGITQKQLDKITVLQNERDTGKNVNGNSVKWTNNKKTELQRLIDLRDAPEELPTGVKTYLDKVYDKIRWKRERIIHTRQMEKGTNVESDSLQLMTDVDKIYYAENTKQYENDFITGEPDNAQYDIKEIKSNYDLESFRNATLTSLYKWQIRAYCWLCNKEGGELVYCLVNNTYIDLKNTFSYEVNKTGIDFEMYQIPGLIELHPEYAEKILQIERNMIFDTESFVENKPKNEPEYKFLNDRDTLNIPKALRIKRFPVELLPEHITFIKKRIRMARTYLMEKEKEELEKIKSISLDDYNKQIEIIKNKLKNVA